MLKYNAVPLHHPVRGRGQPSLHRKDRMPVHQSGYQCTGAGSQSLQVQPGQDLPSVLYSKKRLLDHNCYEYASDPIAARGMLRCRFVCTKGHTASAAFVKLVRSVKTKAATPGEMTWKLL
ncbi:hypothetical protein EVAR_76797_1 [Eumeta japonica]|uniref:Uncharacterized protein n=1 Tax=Eumeta variegata TaxID=151549 RepID=A0A4C1SW03_EUMVA|nr:hypothetical protein EVAR_76797_1 [Eumeta japonica]